MELNGKAFFPKSFAELNATDPVVVFLFFLSLMTHVALVGKNKFIT